MSVSYTHLDVYKRQELEEGHEVGPFYGENMRLDILMENMGRVNYGPMVNGTLNIKSACHSLPTDGRSLLYASMISFIGVNFSYACLLYTSDTLSEATAPVKLPA